MVQTTGPYRLDTDQNRFVEYFLPYRTISVMHMAGQDEMRWDAGVSARILDQLDRSTDASLRFCVRQQKEPSAEPLPAALLQTG
jgi:hypothetical protein